MSSFAASGSESFFFMCLLYFAFFGLYNCYILLNVIGFAYIRYTLRSSENRGDKETGAVKGRKWKDLQYRHKKSRKAHDVPSGKCEVVFPFSYVGSVVEKVGRIISVTAVGKKCYDCLSCKLGTLCDLDRCLECGT